MLARRRAVAHRSCSPPWPRPASTSWTTPSSATSSARRWTSSSAKSIFPVLTPQAFDPGHPFPHISNLSLNLAVVVRAALGRGALRPGQGARPPCPACCPSSAPPGGERKDGTVPFHHWFVWLEQVIAAHLDRLFPGVEVVHAAPFRVTRNADVEIQELEASDLLETMTENVRERRFGAVVRLELDARMPDAGRAVLVENLAPTPTTSTPWTVPWALSGLMQLCDVDRYELKDPPLHPAVPAALARDAAEAGVFAAIRQGDILLHHPYTSFDPVIDFLKTAARDPRRAGHQADPLPRGPQLAGGEVPARGPARAPQAGDGAGGAEGPLRRGEQHRLGQDAGARGRARHLRHAGAEDPRQAPAGGAPRGRRPAPLPAPGHRQLQPPDRPHLRGPGPA